MTNLRFSQKLQILRMDKAGITHQAIANQFEVSPAKVAAVISTRSSLERFETEAPMRRNLTMRDKIRVLHPMDMHQNQSQVGGICKIHRKTVKNVLLNRTKLLADEAKGIPSTIKRPLRARFPDVEADVLEFIKFVRSERLPVTSYHVKARALRAATKFNDNSFRASNGWLQKFIRRSAIQRSFKLHGKGGVDLPVDASARMQEIRDITSEYELKNIYNMDESALFYRMGPRQTYLTDDEDRNTTRGTDLQKHKRRVSIVMCTNADGSHIVPVSYIGAAAKPNCFLDSRFAALMDQYWSQSNGWMDNKGFAHWINEWYKRVQENSEGPWLLLMDNCGGHELTIQLDRVRIEFLPPRSTAKHQPLDLGLIASAKIRYRSKLLSAILDVLELRRNTNHSFKPKSANGKWGIQDGLLPHVGDAIMLFNSAWSMMSRTEVIKCWMKSDCLGNMHQGQSTNLLSILQENNDVDIDLTDASCNARNEGAATITNCEAQKITQSMNDYRHYADDSETPLHQIVSEVSDLVNEADLMAALNSPAPDDNVSAKSHITVNEMMELYENEAQQNAGVEEINSHPSLESVDTLPTLNTLSQAASEAIDVTNDELLRDALRVVEERINILKGYSN